MTRAQFHSLYSQMPEGYRAELLGGVVFEPSPLSWSHSKHNASLSYLFMTYSKHTPGTEVGENATLILGEDDEVQPDLILRIREESGGQSCINADDYLQGAPELVAEIAVSSKAIDLTLKKQRYALTGVLEYIVVCVRPKRLYWFDLRAGKDLKPGFDGVYRSAVFPGLWIHPDGVLRPDSDVAFNTLSHGLQSQEHAAFCRLHIR